MEISVPVSMLEIAVSGRGASFEAKCCCQVVNKSRLNTATTRTCI